MGQPAANNQNGSTARLDAVAEALVAVRADVGALGELSAKLARTLGALEAEVGVLAEQARAAASAASETPQAFASDGERPARSTDVDGARLVALNMALNGDPRERVGEYLSEHYELPDGERLLDEVYAAIEG